MVYIMKTTPLLEIYPYQPSVLITKALSTRDWACHSGKCGQENYLRPSNTQHSTCVEWLIRTAYAECVLSTNLVKEMILINYVLNLIIL